MILYHGTTVDIKEIDLQKSKPNKKSRLLLWLIIKLNR